MLNKKQQKNSFKNIKYLYMIWSDKGYLLSKNKFNENSIIAKFFTENHGKCSGIIYGATSKKIKNYLQIGNKYHINIILKMKIN